MAWDDWPGFSTASIAVKELLPIVVAAAVWGEYWFGSTVVCHCDNQAVVAAIKGGGGGGYCRDPGMAHLEVEGCSHSWGGEWGRGCSFS